LPVTRRHFAAAAAVGALAAGAGFWSLFGGGRTTLTAEVDLKDLAIPSPLGDMALGSAKAPVTIIEYASMTCPHCAEFHRTVFPELEVQYIDTGKVRFVFREFPIEIKAASCSMLARCIGKDDPRRYHAAIDALFAIQDRWMLNDTAQQLRLFAKQAGMSDENFNACMADQKLLAGLEQCRDHAHGKLKVDSTPTFFINGKRLVGALPFERFSNEIEANLRA